ncbi:MAG: hypothetical protein DRI80_16095 [Chloroflexota bacterium]|nr:MAG: hypothetical protein DRI80_16095 [Chloroflexota bacterium]
MTTRSDRIAARRAYGGVLVVNAVLNGIFRVELLVDTAAAITSITPRTAERLGIEVRHPLRHDRVATAHSRRLVLVPVVKLDSIAVGPFQVEGLEVQIIEFPSQLRIHGSLGINFLARFRPTFEFDTATLILRPLPG